ncbi:MAG TPA: site-2 protease family protein, partial [Bacillota bacterium]|nr:site-2 protease family protein [Bacillota bacterium]
MIDNLPQLIFILPLVLISLSIHEFSHGWIAYRLGDMTAKEQGRLRLNPLAHLDPIGTLMLVLSMTSGFGIGWAKPV